MDTIPFEHGLLLASALFALGLVGVTTRRNIVFVLMSLEIMLNATGLVFVVGSSRILIHFDQILIPVRFQVIKC